MATIKEMPGVRREYRLKTWILTLYMLLGIGFIGGGLFVAWMSMSQSSSGAAGLPFLLLFVPGGYLLLAGLRSRVVVDGSRITVRGAFQEKSADLSEIEGFRTINSRNSSYRQLVLKEGRGNINLQTSFNTDDDFREWFQNITDLDERDRQSLLDEIANRQELGATAEERLDALKRAKTWNIALTAIAILCGIAIDFNQIAILSSSTIRLCTVLLALTPVVAAVLAWRSPLLYAAFKRKKDPRADINLVLLIAGLALFMRAVQVHYVAVESLLLSMIVTAAALAVLYFRAAKSSAPGAFVGLLMFIGFYSYGVVAVADSTFDNSTAVVYATAVLGQHESHGKSTTYYLRLAPWGPFDDSANVSVPRSVYISTRVGDTICLALHSGSLHAQWFILIPCVNPLTPASADSPGTPQ